MDYRKAYGLPDRYFLSLGRMVEKKNLSTLVMAYARFARASGEKHGAGSMEQRANLTENCKLNTEHRPPGLVFVGSGELEGVLREQARALGLRVVERTDWKVNGREEAQEGGGGNRENGRPARWYSDVTGETPVPPGQAVDRTDAGPKTKRLKDEQTKGPRSQAEPRPCETGLSQNCELNTENSVESDRGAVYFYGFRQIEENPVFYALAEAFVLPSLKEEWGLVVNEAMAAGLPVIVSRTAGCAEDLVPKAPASRSMEHGAGGMESGNNSETDGCRLKTENSLEERSNGFIFDPSSVDALSEALRRIAVAGERLQVKGNDLEEMGRRSREIISRWGCDNFAQQALSAARAAQQA